MSAVWPTPHAAPTSEAVQTLRRSLTMADTAARWSTSSACRSPRTKPKPRRPSPEPVMPSSDLAERLRDDEESRDRHEQGSHDRGIARNEAAPDRDALEPASGMDEEEADRGQHRGEAEAEGDDQGEPERDPSEGDRAEHHDERRRTGKEAAGDAERDDRPPAGRALGQVMVVVMIVGVAVVMVVRMIPVERDEEPGERERRADREHAEARGSAHPWEEPLRADPAGSRERQPAERVHASAVRRRHDRSQDERVHRRAAGADQVSAHYRLPVAGSERVEGAERGRD